MLRIVFILLVTIHGIIHLLGFSKAFELADVSQLTRDISKSQGILWLATALLFLLTVLLYFLKKDIWWMTGIISVLLSQWLIFMFWQDAKFGTIANLIILLIVLTGFGNWSFGKMVAAEVASMHSTPPIQTQIITDESISHLPEIVQAWQRYSNVLGKGAIEYVHLIQTGQMKTTTGGNWLPVHAEQWFTIDDPEFIWKANVGRDNLMQFAGRDKYMNGKGEMNIRLYSLFSIVNANGPQIDRGSALRYLAEMIWFPSAASNKNITWEEHGLQMAKATLNQNSPEVSGIFTFNADGKVLNFEADRFYDKSGKNETWFIEIDQDSYKQFDGIMIPTKASVTWKLNDGDFTWFQLQIEQLEYDR